jgi:hypothetical protein
MTHTYDFSPILLGHLLTTPLVLVSRVPRSAVAAFFSANDSYSSCLLLDHYVLWQSQWELARHLTLLFIQCSLNKLTGTDELSRSFLQLHYRKLSFVLAECSDCCFMLASCLTCILILKMAVTCSSKMSVDFEKKRAHGVISKKTVACRPVAMQWPQKKHLYNSHY